jgi:hypothetical protein
MLHSLLRRGALQPLPGVEDVAESHIEKTLAEIEKAAKNWDE